MINSPVIKIGNITNTTSIFREGEILTSIDFEISSILKNIFSSINITELI
jgi:hypothetical protein